MPALARLTGRLPGVRSRSARFDEVMRDHAVNVLRGFEAGNPRAAQMRDAGMTPQEIMDAAVAERSPEVIAYAGLVARVEALGGRP